VDSLAPEQVEPLLRGRFGRPYVYAERVESTQRELPGDAPEGAVVATDEQTAGRGRLGRTWHAPARTSVLFSIVLRPNVRAAELPDLSVVAGRAVARALERVAHVMPSVKLPNDVLVNGKKVAGILAEASDGRVMLGIGINVNQSPDELPPDVPATSLRIETGDQVDRRTVLVTVLDELELQYERWLSETAERG
jgi:BirA family biotin operon repressor/biotin-[acetyl-CoA-carboxylase] ligase